jgi:hypothetical protein
MKRETQEASQPRQRTKYPKLPHQAAGTFARRVASENSGA